ncbi:hypothetical protein CsatA_014905 [Cannabis sativa]
MDSTSRGKEDEIPIAIVLPQQNPIVIDGDGEDYRDGDGEDDVEDDGKFNEPLPAIFIKPRVGSDIALFAANLLDLNAVTCSILCSNKLVIMESMDPLFVADSLKTQVPAVSSLILY